MSFQIIMRTTVLAAIALIFPFSSSADEKQSIKPRILDLVPECWIQIPAIDPAIPKDYTFKELDNGKVVWGTEEDLSMFPEKGNKINSEVIELEHCPFVKQLGASTFVGEEAVLKSLKECGAANIKTEKRMWGNYPLLVITGHKPNGIPLRIAFLGLNTLDGSDLTMFIGLHSSEDYGSSSPIWDKFITNTQMLDEEQYLRAMGMDMHDNYTIFKLASTSVKVTAEKRKKDSLLVVLVEPISKKTTFRLDKVTEMPMTTNWKGGEPTAKVFGTVTEKEGKFGTCIVNTAITAFIREVDEFSFDIEKNNYSEDVVIYKYRADQSRIEKREENDKAYHKLSSKDQILSFLKDSVEFPFQEIQKLLREDREASSSDDYRPEYLCNMEKIKDSINRKEEFSKKMHDSKVRIEKKTVEMGSLIKSISKENAKWVNSSLQQLNREGKKGLALTEEFYHTKQDLTAVQLEFFQFMESVHDLCWVHNGTVVFKEEDLVRKYNTYFSRIMKLAKDEEDLCEKLSQQQQSTVKEINKIQLHRETLKLL